jgi:predicted RNase H-like nuclease (RuvC/YqgF family)
MENERNMQAEIDRLRKQLAEKDLITTEAKVQAEVQKKDAEIINLRKELENRPEPTDAPTLKVVDFDRDIHSGLPKGTILGVLES